MLTVTKLLSHERDIFATAPAENFNQPKVERSTE